MTRTEPGKVFLVGAGPGDPGLITLRGAELLSGADVVVYDGLANALLLDLASPTCEAIYAGKKHSERGAPLTQRQIETVLVEKARQGLRVVRLKGGDPFLFGRGGEEAEALVAAGIPFEVVPGVTAATAVPAYAGIPLTHRDAGSSVVALTTGQESDSKDASQVDFDAVARADTIVLFMAVKTLPDCVSRLLAAGRPPSTPAAVIRWGTTAAQKTIVGTLEDIVHRVEAAALLPPALVVIGEVVRLRERISWYEKRPLFGRRVLVPRQKEQASGFARVLVGMGAEPILCEVTRITEADPIPLETALGTLPGGFEWIAFTSANAVERTLAALLRMGRDTRGLAGVKLAAVGAATEAALTRWGLRADLVPEHQDGAGVAAALLAKSRGPNGLRVLLPRAAEGREELTEALMAAGVHVSVLAAYRTIPQPRAQLEGVLHRLRQGELDVLTFFAPSQVHALVSALGPGAAEVLNRAGRIAAIGSTTAEALRQNGVRIDLVPLAPSAEMLAQAILDSYLTAEAL